ncbi:universal stress protein [Sphingobacterium sp. UT-1RO-CII-1]|uniref:universal stress protein n=1 Tax=Sphingobacterium sp. UT-1RO-CII-1 TaxID=2995225 RepID=UPI00227C3EA5|nr:universal stress protein [Sphingobacterium sp. UT-1RO-CII-1]MCY4780166.1 universal stress protein [Sphingobacterium sp. UT-1RO-CII-1]
MKKILVPTDFSENALLAAKYAADLCQRQGYTLHILHYYTVNSSGFSENDLKIETTQPDILKADLTILKWVELLKQEYPTVNITQENKRGLISERLVHEAKETQYLAIVMGTTGSSANKNIFWGSNTSSVIAKSPIPVIAVPNTRQYAEIKNVGLLTNFKEEELLTLREFLNIYQEAIALHLIHVHENNEDIQSRLKSWLFNIQEFPLVTNTNILTAPLVKDDKNKDSIPEVIKHLTETNELNMILVSKSRKTFFQRLFSNSVSKAMALELKKPAFFGKSI